MKTHHINALCLSIIALCYIITTTEAAQCYAYLGPNGARQCVKISGYTDYQWATCRTDSYLKSTSGGTHHCSHPLHTYCWYQCMLENYGQSSGDVLSSCRCTPVSTSFPRPPVSTSFPVSTSSPASISFPVNTDQCNAYRGPSGARRCIKISGFTDYQWATCRTDSYLRSTSGGRHHCRNQLHTYCWYQCMLDKYGQESGVVYSSCRCTPVSTSSPGKNSASKKEKFTLVFVVLVAISCLQLLVS